MKNWARIVLVFSILVGGAAFFGHWSLNQFDNAFDNLSAAYTAEVLPVQAKPNTINIEPSTFSTSTKQAISAADLKFYFTFPREGSLAYAGCTYNILWQSSTTISSLEAALVDAGTREAAGPIASGISKENTLTDNLQSLKWKVGNVWPGEYFISISKIDGLETEQKSEVFTINKMPSNLTADEQQNLCKETSPEQ